MASDDEALFDVVLTQAFDARLDAIQAFYLEAGVPAVIESLVAELRDTVVPNLRRFPRMGRPYARRAFLSAEAKAQLAGLAAAKVGRLREYLNGDYLILYAVDETAHAVHLLTIRHHRQLSFDFHGLWQGA